MAQSIPYANFLGSLAFLCMAFTRSYGFVVREKRRPRPAKAKKRVAMFSPAWVPASLDTPNPPVASPPKRAPVMKTLNAKKATGTRNLRARSHCLGPDPRTSRIMQAPKTPTFSHMDRVKARAVETATTATNL